MTKQSKVIDEILDKVFATAYNRGLDHKNSIYYSYNDNKKVKAQAKQSLATELVRMMEEAYKEIASKKIITLDTNPVNKATNIPVGDFVRLSDVRDVLNKVNSSLAVRESE